MNVAECKKVKSISIGIGNTFCQSTITAIDNSFHKYC